jgi:Origin recognition complex (ORC) subunit 5 C-terminus
MALHPIRIHFAAYSDDQTLRDILMTRDNLPILVGNCGNTGFQKSLVNSFVGTLIQVMRSITRDIRIILRAGVRLWDAYTEPLLPDNIQSTINQLNLSGKDHQQEMLSFLGQRLIKLSRNINEVVLSVGDTVIMGNDYDDLPYLAKCMIMASYICQHNNAKKDKTLFTIYGNAKSRHRKHHGYDGIDPEKDAFAIFDPNRSKALRSKGFPLERMLSITTRHR